MPATVDIGTLITSDPGMHSGKPCIAGTGTTVLAIVERYEQDWSPEKIAEQLDLPLEGVFAALAYARVNRDEIEEWFRLENEAHATALQREVQRRSS